MDPTPEFDHIIISRSPDHFREKLGQGTHGSVYRTTTEFEAKHHAVKILSCPEFAFEEIQVLETLKSNDESGQQHCVVLESVFRESSSVFIVMPLYGPDLAKTYLQNSPVTMCVKTIKNILSQALTALAFVHSLGIIHTDVKPANIVVETGAENVDGHRTATMPKNIRLIDFGSAVIEDRPGQHQEVISTPPYRSPEAILRLPQTCATDVWSLACTIIECSRGSACSKRTTNCNTYVRSKYWLATYHVKLPRHGIGAGDVMLPTVGESSPLSCFNVCSKKV